MHEYGDEDDLAPTHSRGADDVEAGRSLRLVRNDQHYVPWSSLARSRVRHWAAAFLAGRYGDAAPRTVCFVIDSCLTHGHMDPHAQHSYTAGIEKALVAHAVDLVDAVARTSAADRSVQA